MNKSLISLVLVAVIGVIFCAASPYRQCSGKSFDNLENRIKVEPCGEKKCKLPKLGNVTVAFMFKPKQTVHTLTNDVSASVSGINLPFLGVTQTSACNNVRRADTDELVQCPLEPGVEYVYKNWFHIYPIYPETNLIVHWSLDSSDGSVICFEVPAEIVKAKSKKNSH